MEPATLLRTGADITLAGYGMMLNQLLDCADRLARNGIQAEVVKLNAITPIPLERLTASVQKTGRLLVAEDSAAAGGVGQRIAAGLFDAGIQVRGLALANTGHAFVTHGTVPQLQRLCGLDGASYITEHWRSAVMANVKKRLDVLLVERGLAESRQRAQAVIMSGQVYVREQKVDKAGTQVEENAPIEVRGQALAYVSRGGLKLEKASRLFRHSLKGSTCH